MVVLDFIRYHRQLMGTKIGCREGDCGACTVLVGELTDNRLNYTSATSCLMPLGNVHRKHIVTVEGLNPATALSPVQEAMAEEGATQCGFCTPGFVVSLSGFCLSGKNPNSIITSIDGNICRCTGYKSIERASERIASLLENKKDTDTVSFAVNQNIVPAYFSGIRERLQVLHSKTNGRFEPATRTAAGGTDLYVQQPEEMKYAAIHFLFDDNRMKQIVEMDGRCYMGASVTVTDISESEIIRTVFPNLENYIKLISSTPIRNMATIAGNFVNASPIGDLTIFFLALDATLVLNNGNERRELPLRKFYKTYKSLDKGQDEFIEQIWFPMPGTHSLFNFEKVSKRTQLDIASVNTAINIHLKNGIIQTAGLSAGGVAPVPLFLKQTSLFLSGKKISEHLVQQAIEIAEEEISPISDTRGSADYKRLLLKQLIKAHFIKLFPELSIEKILAKH